MSRARRIKGSGGEFALDFPEALQEVFVEGVSSLAIGYPYSKVLFHSVKPPLPGASTDQTSQEERVAVVQLTIPTAALLEMCVTVVKNTAGGAEKIKAAAKLMQEQFSAQITSIENSVTIT